MICLCPCPAPHRGAVIAGFILATVAAVAPAAHGQSAVWQPQGATSGSIYYNGGNVGIGTTSPTQPLQLVVTPPSPGGIEVSDSSGRMALFAPSLGQNYYNPLVQNGDSGIIYASGASGFVIGPWGTGGLRLDYTGRVGIGTASPQHMLHVAGTIGAEEVIVTSTGADYVFRPDYRLRPLDEVNAFIKENHHLPDIPSEAEVKEKGLSLGDMQARLLAKVEELTLHMIEADERNKALEKQNTGLQERIARLEAASETAK